MFRYFIFFLFSLLSFQFAWSQGGFVKKESHQFSLDGKPYYYLGTNYWYGTYLGLEKDKSKGIERLRKELDFLTAQGVTNLRVIAGAEGSGLVHGVQRVQPPLQPKKGQFVAEALNGLDILLDEMGKRNMKAVVFFSNNWEWSGGFLQYLNWNGLIDDATLRRKLTWDEQRDYVSKFYTCSPCKEDYLKQVAYVLNRTNKVNGRKYIDEPAIMAWELANEPRPMRPAANEAYAQWVKDVAAFIKSKDTKHLVTIGHEGEMGSESMPLFESIHADKNIDYLTIHIWPKNWSWFKGDSLEQYYPQVVTNTVNYINKHVPIARKLAKPLVIEEFGLPRDHHSFAINSSTRFRDGYYSEIFSLWKRHREEGDVIAGANFWAFGGSARPKEGQVFWKEGDALMGDPPMEEQGLNTVFDSDKSTWQLIEYYNKNTTANKTLKAQPTDPLASKETVALYNNLKRLVNKGIMFGHQDALAYGVNWKYQPGRSDVKELVGDYPAVYGWELGNLEYNYPHNLDSVPFDKMKEFIKEGYQRGGVITLSWHNDNPLNGQSAWDTTHGGVAAVLPGGMRHEMYQKWLDNVANFIGGLKGKNGEAIPVLFRPYHELTGNWFWWCQNTNTPTEYKLLWRYTVDYLRNVREIHNVLYVYNTAGDFNSREEFLEYYPGDDVVDMVSFDAYQHGDPTKDSSFLKGVDRRLGILTELAKEKAKIPALAETGYERIPYAQWWTNTLWPALRKHKLSYVLAWRNHGLQPNGNWHYYVPKKNDTSSEDFKKFYQLEKTLFEKEVAKERLYQ
jgi:mannan endo-1,4-beta-mannosidase